MRILYLAHRVPYPPDKGDKIRAFHQIEYLARRHEVHVACLADDRADLDHARVLEKQCASVDVVYRSPSRARWSAVAALPTARPLSVAAFHDPALRRRIEAKLRINRPDAMFVYTCVMAPYVERVRDIPKILDFVDADSEKWRSYAARMPFPRSVIYAIEADRLARYETAVASRFDAAVFVSETEARLLRPRAEHCQFMVIPNGVDLEYFRLQESPPRRSPAIVFTGVMDYFPNVDAVQAFCRVVLPLIQREVPDAEFWIVGRNPAPEVRALARLNCVQVTGAVPDVRPYLARAMVSVAPFRIARGIQNKILEALAMGLPVVCTPVSLQGLPGSQPGGVQPVEIGPGFAQHVLRLLRDPDLWNEQSLRAREHVERHHQWSAHGAQLDAILDALVRPKDPAHASRGSATRTA